MFHVKENDSVGFDSKWKVTKVTTVNSSQTTEYESKEIDTQTATTTEIETQTENTQLPDVEMEKLAKWLKEIYPRVHKELNDSSTSRIFKNYNPIFEDVIAQVKLLQTIKVFTPTENSNEDEAVCVNSLSWNCTGKVLAVSCNFTHKNWCHHTGSVKFYSLTNDDLLTDKPIKKVKTQTCVSYLQFHPTLQNLIACGTYAGEIIVWNIDKTSRNDVICKAVGHEDGITQISWIYDIDPSKTLLLGTSSLDGTLNMWHFSFANSSLKIKEKYKIKAPLLGRFNHMEPTSTVITNKISRGIIAFDFSTYAPQTFVVGAEGGLVVQCSVLGCNRLLGSTDELPISDPVYKYYEPHEGEIQTIKFSPNRREMFLTLGTLGEIRVYVLGQDEPAQVIFLEKPLLKATWIPFEEKLLCGCGEKGIPEIYNVLKARALKNIGKFDIKSCTMTEMVLNSKRPTLVASGNDLGLVYLWNVPWRQFSLKL